MQPPQPDPSSSGPTGEAPSADETPAWVTKLQNGPEYQRRFFAQVLLAGLMFALSSVVELAVPLLRFSMGRRGVQAGPAIGSLLAFVGGFLWLSRVDAGDERAEMGGGPLVVVKDHSIEIAAVGLPALGALLPATVVARGRSPLLAWALMPVPRIAGSVLLAWSIDRAKRRAAGSPVQR